MNSIIDTLFISWNNEWTIWIWMIPLALLTFWFSWLLVRYATGICARSKLSGVFLGIVLISFITSIPELVSQIIQTSLGEPAVAISNDLGANSMTVFIMAVITILFFRKSFMKSTDSWSQWLSWVVFFVSLVFTLTLFFGKDLYIGKKGTFLIGLIPILLVIAYLVISYVSYWYGNRHKTSEEPEYVYHNDNHSLLQIIVLFFLVAIALVGFAILLNWSIDSVAQVYQIGSSSVGGLILSFATALPEMVAFVLFVRKGYIAAAISSVLGSHILNFAHIFIGDMVYNQDPIIVAQDSSNIWLIGVMLSVMLFLFSSFLVVIKKFNSKTLYFSLPVGIILTYIVGWSLIL